jgi:hypothetical protein
MYYYYYSSSAAACSSIAPASCFISSSFHLLFYFSGCPRPPPLSILLFILFSFFSKINQRLHDLTPLVAQNTTNHFMTMVSGEEDYGEGGSSVEVEGSTITEDYTIVERPHLREP